MKYIICVILILILCVPFVGCKSIEIAPIEFEYGSYAQRTNVSFELMNVNASIANGSDKALALEHLIQVADTNLQNSTNVARISFAEGEAYTGGIGGKMAMRMLMLKHGGAFYYETAGSLYEANPAAGLTAGKIFVDQASREYSSDIETFYLQSPNHKGKPQMTEEFPYFNNTYRKVKVVTENIEERDNPFELTKFVFNRNTVLLDSIEIYYNSSIGLYTLTFELNLEDKEARDEATERPRSELREKGSEDLEYVYYKYSIELWDNGLIRTVTAEESWLGSISVFIFPSITGSSESTVVDYYSWDVADSEYLETIDLSWIDS